ncbi:SGNH/GDSL hydrolase family protein [Cribrihabitans neustonicus]|uniref:SGNH/GDSL hydrolase family protein n=1 Tax=Cribrihabitans neustonicus TaxID=1429085 RepID=UPI003B59C540
MTFFARLIAPFCFILLLTSCAAPVPPGGKAHILVMGDSLLAWNRLSGNSIADAVEDALGRPVADRSVSGARHIYRLPLTGAAGLNIARQYRPGPWKWIIVNGGGNDLWLGCGCVACKGKLDRLISEDGESGAIPDLLTQLRSTGARVIYVGYLRSPGRGSLIEHCRDEGDTLERRFARHAESDPGVFFVSLKDMVPQGDRSYHAPDMIHPSVKASREIGSRLAAIIRAQ